MNVLLHAASLSPRLVRESLLEISKKGDFYVEQSENSIFCHWKSCHAARVHVCFFNSTSVNGVCSNPIPEEDEDIEANKVTFLTQCCF